MPCLICDSSRTRLLRIQNGFKILRCTGCGMQFADPIPTASELARYYDKDYKVALEGYGRNMATHEARIVDLERWCPRRGHLLEVGSSYGHTLAIARDRGWQVAGVELSPTSSDHARATFGLEIHNCDLLEAPFPEGNLDAAILWHVLEHTRMPRVQISRLRNLLRPGGVLALRVPNIESFGARVGGRSWPWMCPPTHLWYFSPRTLPRLLEKCGLEVLETRTLRGDGSNFYQHLLIALGGRLNSWRRALLSWMSYRRHQALPVQDSNPPALLGAWQGFLARARPWTDALAQATRRIHGPLEDGGWGDEVLCYARRPASE